MSALIDELKAEHVKLVTTLEKVKQLGPTPEALGLLKQAKVSLLAHLGKEDAKLYPVLKAVENDPEIRAILNLFGDDMEKISKAALSFFAKWENGGSGLEFAKDFGGLMATLGNRIRREEEKLYPLYEKVSTRKKAA